jgi:hypothetical protein
MGRRQRGRPLSEGRRALINDTDRFDGVKDVGVDVWRHTCAATSTSPKSIDLTPVGNRTGPSGCWT